MRHDQRGYIVVETIGAFVPFVLLIISILSLVNIVAVQARVHYALTQTAETLSMYSYTLDAVGVANAMMKNGKRADDAEKKSKEIQKNLTALQEGLHSCSINQMVEAGTGLKDSAKDVLKDPLESVRLMLNYGLDKAGDAMFAKMVRPLVVSYLKNGDMSGDEYLKSVHVDALDFADGTTLLDGDGNIKLVVHYSVDYTFGALPLPFDPSLKITQSVMTKAWLNGNGEGYSG